MSSRYKILCPVDYSDSSDPAVSLAARIASAQDSLIILLHVKSDCEPISISEAQIKSFRRRMCDQYLSERAIPHEIKTRSGRPANKIIEMAQKFSVDAIVMGTHGRTGLSRVIAGSVAQEVMSKASCPVVTVKLPDKPA